jgi:hypothetical protein
MNSFYLFFLYTRSQFAKMRDYFRQLFMLNWMHVC